MSAEEVWSLALGCFKNQLFIDQVTTDCMWYMPMIICAYMVIPVMAMSKDRLPPEAVLIPCGILFISDLVIPSLNNLRFLLGAEEPVDFALYERYLFSMYFLYIIAGYLISKGFLKKISTLLVVVLLVVSFTAMCFYQDFVWSLPEGYLLDYNFPGYLLIGILVFELFRRAGEGRYSSGVMTYLSKIAFGIFFTHILIMDSVEYFMGDVFTYRIGKTLALEAISLAGSIAVIWLISRSKKLGKLFFMLK